MSKPTTTQTTRILSIDIMRGLTLFLMLFVNDLYMAGVPQWLGHRKADFDGMGLADWVFPGFLFMVGISIPFAMASRLSKGHSKLSIFGHVLIRTLSLLIIGVLSINVTRLNPELSGLSNYLWAILSFICIFLIWNHYPNKPKKRLLFNLLKVSGILGLLVLVIIFRSGEKPSVSWLTTGWWGILGLIGWGYFIVATIYLFVGPRLTSTIAIWFAFIALNVLSLSGMLHFLNPLKPILGVIINGNIPSIVISGLIIGLLLKQHGQNYRKVVLGLLLFSMFSLVTGFILRNWFIISKMQGTPSWAMICNGITGISLLLVYLIIDRWGKTKWAAPFKAAGQNSLTTYLFPSFIYFIMWELQLPRIFYKQENSELLAISGSLGWAILMIGLAVLLSKIHIRLKL